ncbi:MAG: propanediol dehydratase small subunit [Clostridiales bacterium]|jgi:propanediol dehydratase small subunit|nr:propanediol dehydratase small subunit [Clostridiales bacterium]
MDLYPLSEKIPEHIKSKTGKRLNDITLNNVLNGDITSEDIKISKETLLLQAEVARSNGRPQIAKNLIRAAELTDVPDDEILKIYDLLRPYRATEQELFEISNRLRNQYGAEVCADFILETISVYKKRNILKK